MIALFGKFALLASGIFALLQTVVPFIGFVKQNPYQLASARVLSFAQCSFVFLAYILLTVAFVTNDFTLLYVAENSHASLPFMYRATALWGGHEGSVLLWLTILSVWTIALALFIRAKQLLSLTLSICGLISFCFIAFILFTSNPFLTVSTVLQGQDLNPLLQDPGFIIHPPMLYTGYVGFSAAFAVTLAALIIGKLDAVWAHMTRQFALAAWCFLTFGIMLGSWWAYRVLGWGGFWFWDPVENASLLPWLSGTALIHVLILAEKRGIAIRFSVVLAIITFVLSLLGTFLVRSGVLISAHTFANDPARGIFLLGLLAIILIIALCIYVKRIHLLQNTNVQAMVLSLQSRDLNLLMNGILLLTGMSIVLLGTLYPLIIDSLALGAISVGAPYFNTVMLPMVFIVMLAMGFGALSGWHIENTKIFWRMICKKIIYSFLLAICFLWIFDARVTSLSLGIMTCGFWVLLSLQYSFKSRGMLLAHTGFAILVLGVVLSSLFNEERDVRMQSGESVPVGSYQFLFVNTIGIQGANYRGIQGIFDVTKNEKHIATLYPEKRIYTVRDMVMTKVDIHPGLFRDLYIALGEPFTNNDWSVRIYYKPFIRWIWLGGLIMMLGGFLAIKQRYTRVE